MSRKPRSAPPAVTAVSSAPPPAAGIRIRPADAVGMLAVTIHYLEMTAPPLRPAVSRPCLGPMPELTLIRLAGPGAGALYRELFFTVGAPWLWSERTLWNETALNQWLADARVAVWLLRVGETIAGFGELSHIVPAVVELSYFGLRPEWIGHGLGPWFLDQVIRRAWEHPACWRLGVYTSSFDHPRALPLYQAAGFRPLHILSRKIPDPRQRGILPLNAAPHVPPGS